MRVILMQAILLVWCHAIPDDDITIDKANQYTDENKALCIAAEQELVPVLAQQSKTTADWWSVVNSLVAALTAQSFKQHAAQSAKDEFDERIVVAKYMNVHKGRELHLLVSVPLCTSLAHTQAAIPFSLTRVQLG
jgi:hypothetical protein